MLNVSYAGNAQYWDGPTTSPTGSVTGGSGTWNSTTNNWTNSTGAANGTWQGGSAIFNAPGGTVTLASPISAQSLIFNTTGYVLSGTSALTLTGAGSGIDVSNSGKSATISVPIAGTVGLAAEGAGTLILASGANTYTGATTVMSGTLQIGTTACGRPGSIRAP